MRFLLDAVYLVAALILWPLVLYRRIRFDRYKHGWAQRTGRIHQRNPEKKCIWIHAVSVGEVNAAKTVITRLTQEIPEYEIIITTTTDTGFAQAQRLFAKDHLVSFFPFDISFMVQKAFNSLKPCMCILMELEVWPNFMSIAHQYKVPVIVLNGRISTRSFKSYCKAKGLLKQTFARISLILAQTDQYAQRFISLGCNPEKVITAGSLKYDTAQITDSIEGAKEIAEQLNLEHNQIWVAGGTGTDEEIYILKAYQILKQDKDCKNLRLVIVPRKPERFNQVAQLIKQMGFELTRYSKFKTNPDFKTTCTDSIILGDTMGDLRKFYSLATVVFTGRSLVPMGGSDMMEAAALGKPTIFGKHTFNFTQTVNALLAANGAVQISNQDQLVKQIKKCLSDKKHRDQLSRNGQQVIIDNQGATEFCIKYILQQI